ncbi:MAG TPA: thiamine pyrophosphate-dependent dehydrogenase E1 component subunit alpha [Planctomycetota bacterium]|nr:thiamine pyrophosphate-dependent dehydrogenase E1 component subunit alpha [Planctomycetota bacterium]
MLRRMYRIRHFEEKVFELVTDNKVSGASHVYSGQEAVAVGACSILRDDDYITSTHRGHGHCIARGGVLKTMLAELAGRATGYCRGKGGSMHIADVSSGNLGATGIVGGNIPVAVGAGLACRFEKRGQAVVCFFGDGAANNGTFHESLNLASIWDLPVVFVCENNHFAMSFPAKQGFKAGNIFSRAQSYGMEGVTCDGMHVLEVREAVGNALQRARDEKGPTLIEAVTYRYRGHSRSDAQNYRTKEEVEEWKARDPIDLFRIILAEADAVSPEAADAIEEEVAQELEAAVKYALEQSPYPHVSEVLKDVYKGWIEGPYGLMRE